MKKLTLFLCSLALVFCVVGIAGATPWTHDVAGPVYIGWGGSFSYQHDIKQAGFVPGSDLALNYVLDIGLYDDNRGWDEWLGPEWAYISQPGTFGDGSYNFTYANQEFGASLLGLVQINLFGTLNVTIQSLWGDFYFGGSNLTVSGISNSTPVPEPYMVLLMGAGFLGLVAYGRKKVRGK